MASVEDLRARQLQARQRLARQVLSESGAGISEPSSTRARLPLGTRAGVISPDGQSATVNLFGPTVQQQQASQDRTLGVAAPGTGTALARGFARQALDNLLAVPEVGFNLPQRAITSGINAIAGTNIQPLQINMPSAAEVTADLQALVGSPGALVTGDPRSFGQRAQGHLQRQQNIDTRFQEEAPIATTVGEIGGDIATILATRGVGRAATTGSALPAFRAAAAKAEQTAQSVVGSALQSLGRATAATGKRAAETGAETALLASLQGADTMQAGAIAAGAEAGTAPLRGGVKLLASTRLGQALTLGFVVAHGAAQWVPGADLVWQDVSDVTGTAFNLAALGIVSGAVSGRLPQKFFGPNFGGPAFTELFDVVKRGTLESLLVNVTKDQERTIPVIRQFTKDPNSFGAGARAALVETLTEGGDLVETIDRLQQDDPRFARTFEAVSQGLPVPVGDLVGDAVASDNEGNAPLRSATGLAEVAAARLGRERAKGFGFESREAGPKTFINRAIEGGGGEILRARLSSRDWQDLLVADLEGRLQSATVKRNGQRFLDGNKLAAVWARLPKAARALYPKGTEDAVLALADRARQSRINVGLPQFTARSLLRPDGQLRSLLNDDANTNTNTRSGKRSRGLLED